MKVFGVDYKPFGDSLTATGELPNQGIAGHERDEEMGYYQMGHRLYNPAIGRFMAVDPLFESFPTQSPYAYAFNSPMQWRDPSGLAPEKEKRRDRVQNFDMNEYWIGYGLLQKAISWFEDERAGNYYEEMDYRQNMHFLAQSLSSRLGECGGGGGNKVENGQGTVTYVRNKFAKAMNYIDELTQEDKLERGFIIYEINGEIQMTNIKVGSKDQKISFDTLIEEVDNVGGSIISFVHSHVYRGPNSDMPSMVDIGTATRYPGASDYVVSGGFVTCYGTNDPNDAVTYGKAFESWELSNPGMGVDDILKNWGYQFFDEASRYRKQSNKLKYTQSWLIYLNSDLHLNFYIMRFQIKETLRGIKLIEVKE